MLAILYLMLATITGWMFLCMKPMRASLGDKPGSAWILLAGSFFTGTLVVTWTTYLLASVVQMIAPQVAAPLFWANLLTLFLVVAITSIYVWRHRESLLRKRTQQSTGHATPFSLSANWPEAVLLLLLIGYAAYFMFLTFNQKGDTINIGYSVFGDVGPHLAMIRSFSQGRNFPTAYPYFNAEGIRYHFLFQFLCGNLEYLGLRVDWAFNLPSILSFALSLLLLHVLAHRLTGSRAAGVLSVAFFLFRSSFGFFKEFHQGAQNGLTFTEILVAMRSQKAFTVLTQHDDWGMWNQNVFINQRHLLFSVGILLLVLILMLPRFDSMTEALQQGSNQDGQSTGKSAGKSSVVSGRKTHSMAEKHGRAWKLLFSKQIWLHFAFSREAWLPQSLVLPVFCGLLLGGIGFWNGAVVVAAMPILFFLAVASRHRLEYLVLVLVAGGLVLLQSAALSHTGAGIVSPQITTWFLADQNTLPGLLDYLARLLGVMPLVLLFSLSIHAVRRNGWLLIAFSAPFVVAFFLQLTPDLAVNHKYITLSVMLLNVLVADCVVQLWKRHQVRMVAGVLVVFLTISGVLDFIILVNRNQPDPATGIVSFKQDQMDPLYLFIRDKTPKDAIFLTDTLFIHPILTAGRRLFHGWVYYSWSAGYDTTTRDVLVNNILSAPDVNTLKRLVTQHGIEYILIDDGMRNRENYPINEALIARTFPVDYQSESGSDILYKVE